jgi:hypothetical protein
MTYEELMAAFQSASPAMSYGGYMQDGVWVPTATPMPNSFALPGGGIGMYNEQGNIASFLPGADGGAQVQAYGPGGEVGDSWYNAPSDWRQTALGMAGVAAPFVIPNALAAGGMLGGGSGAAAAASPNAAIDASLGSAYQAAGVGGAGAGVAGGAGGFGDAIDASLGNAYKGAGITAPAVASGVGGAIDWAKIGGGLLSNPAVWAAGGAALGLAGNGDMTSTQQTSNTSNMTGGLTGGSTGTQTGNVSGTTSTGLAGWQMPYAQQALGNMSQLAGGNQSNASLDTTRGLLTNLATNGDPTVNAAAQQQRALISGSMLNANPYIDRVAQNIGSRMGDAYAIGTRAGQMGAASQSGNWDSAGASQALGLKDRAFGDALGSTMSNLYFGNYQNERAAQDAAARGSINFGNFASNNAMNLGNFGQADWQRPFAANQYLANTINPAWGSQGTSNQNSSMNTSANNWANNWQNTSGTGTNTTTVEAPNSWMAGAGGALAGAGLWNSIFNQKR